MMDDYTPGTPGTPNPGTPGTPGWGGNDVSTPALSAGSAGVWQQPGVVVVVDGKDVKVVAPPDAQQRCRVRGEDGAESTVAVDDMQLKLPVKKDRVMIARGEHVGAPGPWHRLLWELPAASSARF